MPLIYLVWSPFDGARAPANPWDATGLKRYTPSPPRTQNFSSTPVITYPPVPPTRNRRSGSMSERRVPGAVVISGIALLAAALAARWAGRARGAVALQPAAAAPEHPGPPCALAMPAMGCTRPGRPAAGGFRGWAGARWLDAAVCA